MEKVFEPVLIFNYFYILTINHFIFLKYYMCLCTPSGPLHVARISRFKEIIFDRVLFIDFLNIINYQLL